MLKPYLQEPGKYFAGIGLVALGPQVQEVMATPTFAVVNAVPLTNGANEMLFAVGVTAPPKVVALPTTLITPAAVIVPEATYLVGVNVQADDRSRAVLSELCTASVTAVRQLEAARMTSDTLARTV